MSRTSRGLMLAGAILGAGLFAADARAQDAAGWHGSVTPYLWLAGLKGDVGAIVDSPPTHVDSEFPGIFDHLSGAFMGKAEIGYDNFGVLGDIAYLKVAGDHNRHIGPDVALGGEIEASMMESTIAGYWRVYQDEAWDFDVLAGGRYTKTKLEVDLSLNARQVSGHVEQDWWDPVIGARATVRLTDRISLMGYADYGGFGVSSDMVGQVYGGVGWRFTDNFTASLGYRYYKTEFSRGDYSYNVALGGPLIGLSYAF